MIMVFEEPEEVAEAAAAAVAWQVASQPQSTIALAGGSTPLSTYRLLAEANLDWSQVTLWLGDERWVDHEHEDSNTRMIRDSLGAAADRLMTPDHSLGDPHVAASDYTTRLAPHLRDGRADLIVLGMGDDGHTASLFPGTAAIEEPDAVVVANWVESKSMWRLTATLPLICSARSVVFIVTGISKADMVHRVLDHDEPLPAQRVTACNANVTWLLDTAAAAHLA